MLAALALLIVAAAGAFRADAVPADTKSDRDQIRQERATVAANLDVLKASRAEVEKALDALQDNVDAEEAHLDDARRAVDQAQAQIDTAERGIAANSRQLAKLRTQQAAVAVEAYIDPAEGSSLATILAAANASDAVQRKAFASVKAARDADITDGIRALTDTLQSQRRAAAVAKQRAKSKEVEVAARVAKVTAAKEQQQKVVDGVQARIDGQIDRAVELSKQDKQLSYKLALEQAALQARLSAARQAAQAASAASSSGPGYGDGGSESNGPVSGPGAVRPSGSGGGVKLCTVGGITVNCQISSQLQSMLSAAAADGVSLSGGGYRDPGEQIALRQQHCGSSNYAIYDMPSGQCHPPTAKPGSSQHEVGLAIDFSNCRRGSACFRWLSSNANSYGFFNLPSESWHWSINGN